MSFFKDLAVTAAALALSAALLFSGCAAAPGAGKTAEPQLSAAPETTPETVPEETVPQATDDGFVPGGAPSQEAYEAFLGDFRAYDLDGNEVDSSVFAEYEVTMINVWATYCGPCLNEMPELAALADEYADRGFRIIGIVIDAADGSGNAYDGAIDYAKSLAEETGADYLHLLPSETLTSAFLNGVYAVPTTVFVDENGIQLGEEYVGSKDKAGWAEVIEQMLALSSSEGQG